MTHEERLDKSLLKLMWSWAFWGKLISRAHIELCDDKKTYTACTDGKKNIWVCREFLDRITYHETVVLLCHEIMHIVLWQTRGVPKDANHKLWNIAEDMFINDLLWDHFNHCSNSDKNLKLDLNSDFFKNALWPDKEHSCLVKLEDMNKKGEVITLPIRVNDIDKKTVIQIYDEIIKQLPNSGGGIMSLAEGQHTIDDHSKLDEEKDKASDGLSEEEKQAQEENSKGWQRAVMAGVAAEVKKRGTAPKGFEDLVKQIKEPKISWKEMLRNALSSSIITDTSYRRFNKRSIVLGTPMPGYTKDGLSVMVHIDTSGSTSNLLPAFIGEICGIMRQHPGSKVTVVQCDAAIQSVTELDSEKGLLSNPVKGFGGTSHMPVIEYVNKLEESKVPKILISFTDGYSDIPEVYPSLRSGITNIFVMPKDGLQSAAEGFGQLIVIDEEC